MTKDAGGPAMVSVDIAVRGGLRDLGRERCTFGCAKHEQMMLLMNVMPPMSFVSPYILKGMDK